MRFKYEPERIPEHGQVRRRRVFAWRRTKVAGYIIWLETYEIEERYFKPSSGAPGWWAEEKRWLLEWAW